MRTSYVCPTSLLGWSRRSAWGYDASLEGYWAELWREDGDLLPEVRIGPEHLIATLEGLARALARVTGVSADDVFVALTTPVPRADTARSTTDSARWTADTARSTAGAARREVEGAVSGSRQARSRVAA